ncbi:MAG: ester cyclase [bacterium]|nr:ester cyclase [bacterium]
MVVTEAAEKAVHVGAADNPAANKAVVERLVRDIVNGGKIDLLDEVLADGFVAHGVGTGPSGPDGMRRLITTWRTAFPDWQDHIDEMVAEGDLVVLKISAQGTHDGPLLGIEPTGETVQWGMIEMVRLADGKITEQWGYSDFAEVVRHLRKVAAAQSKQRSELEA